MTLVTFGQYITIKREALGMNREEAARRQGISSQSLKNWESDFNKPSKMSLKRLMKEYEMKEYELAPYGLLKDDEKIKIKKHFGIKALLTDILALQNVINDVMTGESAFELNLKANVLQRLDTAYDALQPVSIIDEGLTS